MKNVLMVAVLATAIAIGCGPGSESTLMPLGASSPYPYGDSAADAGLVSFSQGESTDAGMAVAPKGPPPNYGTTTTLANSPPPISGGTLLALKDGIHVVAADSDRDQVYIVDLTTNAVTTIALSPHDEPGRLVEDAQGQVHVVLRSGGAIATIDEASAAIVARRNVCISPRGIDFDATDSQLVVACETGEVITMSPAVGGAPTTIATLPSGLRDVVVSTNAGASPTIYVSRFRTAEITSLSTQGVVGETVRPMISTGSEATLGWRMIASPVASQPPFLVHQFSTLASVAPSPGGYASGSVPAPPGSDIAASCSSTAIVVPAITQSGIPVLTAPTTLVVPVDMVATSDGNFAVIAAGNGHTQMLPTVFTLAPGGCGSGHSYTTGIGQPVAIALLADGSLAVQSREPALLTILKIANPDAGGTATYLPGVGAITLATTSVEDTGHAIFHSNSGSGIACASCHGEGGDDSHVWTFTGFGARRTPSLRGTINGTAPYHWDGTMTDISMLSDQVMTGRMNGPQLTVDQKNALQSWLFAIPAPPLAPGDAALIAQGKALFESAAVGCSGCHSGARFTNNATLNVGTGGSFQVPPLVGVRTRAPYLHNGCAKTLADRFGSCATPQHGNITQLQPSDITALIAYLQSI